MSMLSEQLSAVFAAPIPFAIALVPFLAGDVGRVRMVLSFRAQQTKGAIPNFPTPRATYF